MSTIPTIDEVQLLFDQLLKKDFIGAVEYTTLRRKSNEEGLYLWEIKIKTDIGHDEYTYTREGRYPEVKSRSTNIDVSNFTTGNDIPVDGDHLARCVNGGVWWIL